MELTIWKFQFLPNDRITIEMPVAAKILSLQVQNDIPCIWAVVDPKAQIETRTFIMFGTGHQINVDLQQRYNFIGSFQMMNGHLVFHLFEELKP